MTDADLEDIFAAARATPPQVPDALMTRVRADAQAMQPRAKIGWGGWLRGLGGLPAMGGLVTATCVGFWIGVAPPDTLPDLGGLVLGFEQTSDFETDGFGWDNSEEG